MGVKYYEREFHEALVDDFQEVLWLSRQVIACLPYENMISAAPLKLNNQY